MGFNSGFKGLSKLFKFYLNTEHKALSYQWCCSKYTPNTVQTSSCRLWVVYAVYS